MFTFVMNMGWCLHMQINLPKAQSIDSIGFDWCHFTICIFIVKIRV